ncbi:MAG: pyridoxamine 5'-phosphate oxidase family protein [Thermoleophilia bacterium]|nr:pyridoxamine 5'-phosphate oxidase family protein [Thermoleophilia bacterium]
MLSEEVRGLVRDVRLGFAATVSPDGMPNLSPKGTTLALDDRRLVFADIRSPATVANLRANPAIEVNVVDVGTRRGYRFAGTGRVVEAGDEYDGLLAWYREQGFELEGRADRFVVVEVERVSQLLSPAYDWGSSEEELLRTYTRHYATVWAEQLGGASWPPEIYELHYLADGDPVHGSGHSGDLATWEIGRRPLAEAIDRPGAFLDVGCANGLLLESLVRWSAHPLDPYGVDFAPRLVAEARRRLPDYADRFFVADALEWDPPRRFDFVRTELVYAPVERRRVLVERLLGWLEPGGRLLVCGYGGDEVVAPLEEWGFEPELVREWRGGRSGRRVQLAVVPAAAARSTRTRHTRGTHR